MSNLFKELKMLLYIANINGIILNQNEFYNKNFEPCNPFNSIIFDYSRQKSNSLKIWLYHASDLMISWVNLTLHHVKKLSRSNDFGFDRPDYLTRKYMAKTLPINSLFKFNLIKIRNRYLKTMKSLSNAPTPKIMHTNGYNHNYFI